MFDYHKLPLLQLWQYVRSIFPAKLVDGLFIIFYLVNLAGGLAVTVHILIIMDSLPRITTLIAGIEQVSLLWSKRDHPLLRSPLCKHDYI